MNDAQKKLGLIAGSGELPAQIIEACRSSGRDIFVIGFEDITDRKIVSDIKSKFVHIGRAGEAIDCLKKEGVSEVIMAGRVGRPNVSSLKLDFTGIRLLIKLSRLPSQGDNAVFSAIISFIENYGFKVVGAEDVLSDLLIKEGVLGNIKPDAVAENDIKIGMNAALKIGELDIGQAVIIQNGNILGVEGAEGTDRLISRCKELHNEGPGGVLVKMKKPKQDSRVDLPSIGVNTIENAHKSGLRGIAVEAGGALVINRTKVLELADKLGIFVVGVKKK